MANPLDVRTYNPWQNVITRDKYGNPVRPASTGAMGTPIQLPPVNYDTSTSGVTTPRFAPTAQAVQPVAPAVQAPAAVVAPGVSAEGAVTQPTVQRGTGGAMQVLVNPLDRWKNSVDFIEQVKNIIKRKQQMNSDIQNARTYWRTLAGDTSAFGGLVEPALAKEGMFTDKDLRLLSPADQAAVRASRYSAAQANLQGLSEEAKYRETRTEDIIKNLTDMIAEDRELSKSELERTNTMLDIAKKRKELGLPITAEDLGIDASRGVGDRIGGSMSWRNNNPGNLKYSGWESEYGAIKSPTSDFAIFPDEQSAQSAYQALLTGKGIYNGLDKNSAMLKWSSDFPGDTRAYNYDKLIALGAPSTNKSFAEFTDAEWSQFFNAQKQQEGWKEGTSLLTTTGGDWEKLQSYIATNPTMKYADADVWARANTKLSDGDIKAILTQSRILPTAEWDVAKSTIDKNKNTLTADYYDMELWLRENTKLPSTDIGLLVPLSMVPWSQLKDSEQKTMTNEEKVDSMIRDGMTRGEIYDEFQKGFFLWDELTGELKNYINTRLDLKAQQEREEAAATK